MHKLREAIAPLRWPISKEAGFTIIELVIVIIILGILAAFAVPRFVGLASEARESALLGLEGSLRAAASLAHAKQLAGGGAATASVDMDGQTVTMINRYPTANSAGIVAALQTISGFNTSGGAATAGATLTFQKAGAETAASCQVTYTAPASLGVAPTITPTTGGC